jgi:hypothetical protein
MATITHDSFPAQLPILGAEAVVALDNDVINVVTGRIVRADAEEPHVAVLLLEDGRAVLGSECVFTPVTLSAPAMKPGEVDAARAALAEQINAAIDAMPGDECTAYAVTSLAEDVLGPDWKFQVHAPMVGRPKVMIGRYVGVLADG